MSEHDEFNELTAGGHKASANAKATTADILNLDADDEAMVKYKQSLLGSTTASGASKPSVKILTLELLSPTLPAGRSIVLDVSIPSVLEDTKKNPISIKEGVEYNVRITFVVTDALVHGLQYLHIVKRSGLKVDTLKQMVGSFPPSSEVRKKDFQSEDSPSGMLARSGTYNVRSRITDDDGQVYADFVWHFKLTKEWA